ncbi:hypothetical protein WG904_03455 [Pedobacter sp. Du54]|uniref:hypothetical protein n=1 Tax=Pedobacter anseongensis TaxID=3133439 RepID=UPI0030982CAB
MAFPNQILEDVQRGKSYYSLIDFNDNTDRASGFKNLPCNFQCLGKILRDLNHKINSNNYDEISYGLYTQMMEIIGGPVYIPIVQGNIFYGTGSPSNLDEITSGTPFTYVPGEEIIVPFNNNNELLRNFVAIPDTGPIPNHFEDIDFPMNQGGMGGPDLLFGAFIPISGYRVFITNWPTILNSSLRLTTT